MKKFIIFIVCILCVTILGSCGKSVGQEEEEAGTIQHQIAEAMYAHKKRNVYWKSGAVYYGAYEDCHVFFLPGNTIGEGFLPVGDYTFQHRNGGSLWVYHDGEVYGLYEAYESRVLSEEQLTAFYNDYQTMEESVLKTEPPVDADYQKYCLELSDERLRSINVLWSEKEGRNWNWDGTSGYYGTYGECVVVFQPGMLTVLSGMQVADYLFRNGSSFMIYVFTESEMIDLPMAYEKGLLTYEQIGTIYACHIDRQTQ